jgi:predicted nucleotide-binding protein (sugar kinase/HSP70/actin superfamily)
VCKVVGEFWARRIEGDGNFGMFAFLENQGAEVRVEPLLTWFDYLATSAAARLRDERRLKGGKPWRRLIPGRREVVLYAAGCLIRRCYNRLRAAFGNIPEPLPDQGTLRRLAAPFFNPRLSGGEGHLEVGETLYHGLEGRAHGIIGLKPFGCLPSTQSDAVQVAVAARYPELLYVPIETSGDGEVHALSRAEMALGDARERCEAEFQRCLAQTGFSQDEVTRYVEADPGLSRPLRKDAERVAGIAGTAAAFILSAARQMGHDPQWATVKIVRDTEKSGNAACSPQFAARTRKAEI